jgi:hypothetical protein
MGELTDLISAPAQDSAGNANFMIVRGLWDFAVDGGAIGNLNLFGTTTKIPSGAMIMGGYINVLTVPTSGGAATIAAQVESAGDLQAAAAISGAPWSTTGRKNVTPAFTGTTLIKTTAARDIVLVVATAALTAGKIEVVLFIVPPGL